MYPIYFLKSFSASIEIDDKCNIDTFVSCQNSHFQFFAGFCQKKPSNRFCIIGLSGTGSEEGAISRKDYTIGNNRNHAVIKFGFFIHDELLLITSKGEDCKKWHINDTRARAPSGPVPSLYVQFEGFARLSINRIHTKPPG